MSNTIGGASIEIDADARKFLARIQQISKQRIKDIEVGVKINDEKLLSSLRTAFKETEKAQSDFQKAQDEALQKVMSEQQKVFDQIQKSARRTSDLQAKEFAKTAASAEKEQARTLAAHQKAFDGIARSAQKAAAFQRKQEEQNAAAQARNIEKINRLHAQAIAFDRQRSAEIQKTNAAIAAQNNILGKFSGTIKGLDAQLTKFGLTSKDLAVILGAGLAGGVAFAIRELLRFVGAALTAASQLQAFERLADETFGLFADDVKEFAESAIDALGISERAALTSATHIGAFFKNLGFASADSAKFGKSLTTISVALARASGGLKTTEEALNAVRAALRGEFDPIEQFDIKFNDMSLRQEAVRLGLVETNKELNNQQKALAAYSLILDQSSSALKLFEENSQGLPGQLDQLKAIAEELTITLGEGLLPVVNLLLEGINDALGPLRLVQDVFEKIGAATGGLGNLLDKIPGPLRKIGDIFINPGEPGPLAPLREVIEWITGKDGDDAKKAIEDLAAEEDILTASQNAAAAAAEDVTKAREKLKDKTEDLTDAERRLNRAIADAERSEDRAERQLIRTREDGVKRIEKAEKNLFRARRDAARAIEDAEERIADARLEGFRRIRDARENLSDFERESLRGIEDAEDAVKDAEKQREQAILDAQISIEQAQIEGDALAENAARLALSRAKQDEGLAEAKEKRDQEEQDRLRELQRLERELSEVRQDVADEIADAQEALAEQIVDSNERIADAEEALAEAFSDADRAIADAQERLADAIRDGEEAVFDARDAYNELKEEIRELNEEIRAATVNTQALAHELDDFMTQGGLAGEDITGLQADGRQAGGPVFAGRPYIVGENGEELFVPDSSGFILNSRDTQAVLSRPVNPVPEVSRDPLFHEFMQVFRQYLELQKKFPSFLGPGAIQVFEAVDGRATAEATINRLIASVVK